MTEIRERRAQLRTASTRPRRPRRDVLPAILAACSLVICASAASAQVRGTYLYTLSNFGGRLPYDWARIHVDLERDETYVIYGSVIRVFNDAGMEVFSFGDDLDVGMILDIAVDERGDILLLSTTDSRSIVTRCDYRGKPAGPVEITNLAGGLCCPSGFRRITRYSPGSSFGAFTQIRPSSWRSASAGAM